MDHPKCLALLALFSLIFGLADGFEGVMKVQRSQHSVAVLQQHAARRHARLVRGHAEDVDLPIGGNNTLGLYYAHITIGTPPKNYTVHIDTGSNVLWVICEGGDALGAQSMLYNPRTSKTAKIMTRGLPSCRGDLCPFDAAYGDGRNYTGMLVSDVLTYNKVSGGHKLQAAKARVTFGCATNLAVAEGADPVVAKSVGDDMRKLGIEGLIGFGANSISVISQLASAGKVRKEFAHCLDPAKGGGIFAIGRVAKPEVKMIPMHPTIVPQLFVRMVSVEVGGKSLDLASVAVNDAALFDTGSACSSLPEVLYDFVIKGIFSNKSHLNVQQEDGISKFSHSRSLDLGGFPTINFHFYDEDAVGVHPVPLRVRPQDYLVHDDGVWHVFFSKSLKNPDPRLPEITLGDPALSNKLVVYDLENRRIGWREYDCSSSIQLEDGSSGVCTVGAHSEPLSK